MALNHDFIAFVSTLSGLAHMSNPAIRRFVRSLTIINQER
jgi:hypothetical protein